MKDWTTGKRNLEKRIKKKKRKMKCEKIGRKKKEELNFVKRNKEIKI